ncbi:hypothetical protein [Streptomyces sp. CRN 30]|uniref:hypothetical protein n=1 Tax=Streptomyces sp. CRN 30 TaxID=3075613 RepID=UPI002A83D495|nr:hypothetical protein [Streptomyces sp. CRN 30]
MSDTTRRTLRTVVQTAVALCVLLPELVDAAGLSRSLPWVAGALAVAGAVTRVMALPAVQSRLPAWLRTDPPEQEANEKSTA